MNLSLPNLFAQLLPFIASLFILFCTVGFAIFFKRVFDSEKKFEGEEKNAIHSYKKILLQAHKDAEGILAQAQESSMQFKEEMTQTHKKITENTEKEVKEMIEALIIGYKEESQDLSGQMQNHTKEMFAQITADAEINIKNLLQTFSENTIGAHQRLSKQTDTAFKEFEEKLETYKKEQMEQVAKEVRLFVDVISKEVLEKSLSSEDQERLIFDALEKAKKEGIIPHETI